jgi:CDP-glucose 4,6-dehydratase
MHGFYKNKIVLVTGANGFKGTWLCLWLSLLGAKVYGVGLKINPLVKKKTICLDSIIKFKKIDIRNKVLLNKFVSSIKPQIIFHLAGQPLVLKAYQNPVETFEINGNGTLNILQASNNTKSVKCLVSITSDKTYENKNIIKDYKEDDRIFGDDPYSASKSVADVIINSYQRTIKRKSLAIFSARAGNVIGGGDYSKNRIIPDLVNSIIKEKDILIRNPYATRPWQFVLDPVHGYLILGEKGYKNLSKYSQAYNFGPKAESKMNVLDVAKFFIRSWGKKKIKIRLKKTRIKEHVNLSLNILKAKKELNWMPIYNIKQTLKETVFWFKNSLINKSIILEITLNQIKKFSNYTDYKIND